ncbi:MAG: recombinase family protein [Candidatus Omnitrophica bacterium]|nr:recombinase family protein [Candidatus Omnitrophota bacterium]
MQYFIYTRKSTDEEEKQVLSIEAQLTELREFAVKENLEIIDEYVESKTAKIPGRKIFNEMIDRIEKDGPFGILAWYPDRLARNSIDGGKIIYLVDTGKIEAMKFPTFWFDSTPQGKFMLNIAFGQSKYYIDNLSENVKRGIRQKLRRGEWPALAPAGYLNDIRTHTIVKDPERWQGVKKLFQAYAEGNHTLLSLQKLSLSLGLVSRRTNRAIVISKITDILRNPFYYGAFLHKGELYQASHEPIISKRLFDQVQKVLDSKRKIRQSKELLPFAFRGVFTCGECGRMVTAERKKKPSGLRYIYYRCTKKFVVCKQKYLEERKLVSQFNEIINSVALPDDWADKMLKRVDREIKSANTNFEAEKKKLDSELYQLKDRQEKLLEAYLDKTISHEEFSSAKQKILNRNTEIKEFLSSFQKKGDTRLELFKKWIIEAHQAPIHISSSDLAVKRNFIEKIGSNFLVFGQKALISFADQWLCATKKSEFSDWSG